MTRHTSGSPTDSLHFWTHDKSSPVFIQTAVSIFSTLALHVHPFKYHCSDILWPVPMNQDEIRWLAGQSPHCPTIGLTILSSKCLPICKVDYFCAFWNKTLIQLFNIFYGSRNYIFLKINFNAFYAYWGYLVFFVPVDCKFFEPKGSLTLKMDSDVHDSFISPNYTWISRLLLH